MGSVLRAVRHTAQDLRQETWIQEPALRQIHDTIFVQSMLVGLASTAVWTAVFLPLPAGNYF